MDLYKNYIDRAMQQMALQQAMEAQQARPQAGQLLQRVFQPPAQPPGLPAPPGTVAGGPQAPPPGTPSLPMAPGGGMPPPPMAGPGPMPVAAAALPPAAAPPQIPPFRALPGAQPPPQGGPGEIAPPPAAAPPEPSPGINEPKPIQLPMVFKAMEQLGIPKEKTLTMLEAIGPALSSQNQSELQFAKAQLAASKQAEQTYKDTIQLLLKGREVDVKEGAEARRTDQGDERLRIMRENMENAKRRVTLQYGNDQVRQELTPAGMKVAEELTKAGMPLPGGWSRNGMARGNAILNEMGKHEEGGAGSGAVAAGRSESKSGQMALTQVTKDLTSIKPYKEMLDLNAGILEKLADKAIATNSAWANKSINWLKMNASDNPDVAEYLFQMNTVVTEAARVLNNPRLVGQLTDDARKEMQMVINGNMPLEATKRILARMKSDGANRVTALEKQRERLTKGIGTGAAVPGVAPESIGASQTNSKGWQLMTDKNGNKAYVSPDKTQFEAVQ